MKGAELEVFQTELKVCWERSTSPLEITFFRTVLCENDRAAWLHALVNQYGCKQVKIKHERLHINLTVFTFDKQHEIQLLIMDTWHFSCAILWFPCTTLSLNHPELFKPSHLTSGVPSNAQHHCKTLQIEHRYGQFGGLPQKDYMTHMSAVDCKTQKYSTSMLSPTLWCKGTCD